MVIVFSALILETPFRITRAPAAPHARVSTQMATTTAVAVALIVAVTNFKSIVFHFVATIG